MDRSGLLSKVLIGGQRKKVILKNYLFLNVLLEKKKSVGKEIFRFELIVNFKRVKPVCNEEVLPGQSLIKIQM